MKLNTNLTYLLKSLEYTVLQGNVEGEVTAVVNDSRKVCPGCLFICISGAVFDGHAYAGEVADKGAKVLIVEKPVEVPEDVTVIQVADTRYAMAFISAAYFDHPAEKLKTIGITGTKGKTTTACLVKAILENTGLKVGLIGTIETIIGDRHIPAANTTPESYTLQQYFAEMVEAGLDAVVMEVSSQALMLHRTQGFIFDYGIFTNLEPDHIGPAEHESFEEYLACKGRLFKQCRVGIVNGDDSHVNEVIAGHTCSIERYGFGDANDLQAVNARLVKTPGRLGAAFEVVIRQPGRVMGEKVKSYLKGSCNQREIPADSYILSAQIASPGRFSIYNAMTAIAICLHFGAGQDAIRQALLEAKVKGRIEMVPVSDDFTLMIDYAHNAMSLVSLLTTLKEYEPNRLVCLFGCGGNRSKLRRYEMGEVSGRLADLTIITSDNPRFEKPQDIIDDIKVGIAKTDGAYVEICDRKEAIRYAIKHGQPGDIIVLAGKGHEDYQEIEGVKHPMDERVLITEVLTEENMCK